MTAIFNGLVNFFRCSSAPALTSPDWEAVLEWKCLDGKIARLLCVDKDFALETVVKEQTYRRLYTLLPEHKRLSSEEIIAGFQRKSVYINDDGHATFLTVEKSAFNDVTITENDWGVTVVDTGHSISGNIDTASWGGHAAIFIESIENHSYKVRKADLIFEQAITIRYREIENPKSEIDARYKHSPRSQTWLRSKNLVIKMMNQIELEYQRSRQQKFPLSLCDKNIQFSPFFTGCMGKMLYINCLEWTRYRVYLADIDMPLKLKLFAWESPSNYLGSKPRVIAQEAFGLVTKPLALIATIFDSEHFSQMTRVISHEYGLQNLWVSSDKKKEDAELRELFKDQVTKGKA